MSEENSKSNVETTSAGGGWSTRTGSEEADNDGDSERASEYWNYPFYDSSHTNTNPMLTDVSPESITQIDGECGRLPATEQGVCRPILTEYGAVVGTGSKVVSIPPGETSADRVSLDEPVSSYALDTDTGILLVTSKPFVLCDREERAKSSTDDPSVVKDEEDESRDGDDPTGQSGDVDAVSDGPRDEECGDKDDTNADGHKRSGGSGDEVRESCTGCHTVSAVTERFGVGDDIDLTTGDRVTLVTAIDVETLEIRWRRLDKLGDETRAGLLSFVRVNGRLFLPLRPDIRSGGAGRDVGQIGGYDPQEGVLGGYVSYPYQDFNTAPRGAPTVAANGDVVFQSGGATGEIARIGNVLSRPQWQSYVGNPGELAWQPLLTSNVYVTAGDDGGLVAVDPETGDVLWTRSVPDDARVSHERSVHQGQLIYVEDAETVRCVSTDEGDTQWTLTADSVFDGQHMEMDGDALFNGLLSFGDSVLVGVGNRCVIVDYETGSIDAMVEHFPDETDIAHIVSSADWLFLLGTDGSFKWVKLNRGDD